MHQAMSTLVNHGIFADLDSMENVIEVRWGEGASAIAKVANLVSYTCRAIRVSPHSIQNPTRDRLQRAMGSPIKFEISADWDFLRNVPEARWGECASAVPKVANSGDYFLDRGGTHPKMATFGNYMGFLDFLGRQWTWV